MAPPRKGLLLDVFLNSRSVGRLERGASGAVSFQYDPAWLAWENALPVSHSLPLREQRLTGAAVTAYFDNLLPDGEPIRRQIAERLHAEGYDACSLLAAIGRDCVGALQFLPAGEIPEPAGIVSCSPIADEAIAQKLANLARAPLGLNEDEDFRISLAGAQEKTALLRIDGAWHLPRDATPTTHILKPQLGFLPNGMDMRRSVENEHFCMSFLAALGMPVARTEIIDFHDRRVLVIERFDRLWTADGRLLRLPQEDCCQALGVGPTAKYEAHGGPGIAKILELLKASDDAAADRRLFFKALLVFWLLGATDGHAKNFSLALAKKGSFRLTPLYDVVSLQPVADAGHLRRNQMKFSMAVGKSRHYVLTDILPRHFRQTACAQGFPDAEVNQLFAELRRDVPAAIERTAALMGSEFPGELIHSIADGVRKRMRLIEAEG
jgi:serine/threonine-protein kinase HipA